MDLFQFALQGKVMLMYEYFLVGSVLDSAKDGFLEILRGLCDNPENRPIEFVETEYVYTAGNYKIDFNLKKKLNKIIFLYKVNSNGSNITVRARSNRPQEPGQHCHLRYLGQTDLKMDKERKAMVRTFIDCLTSSNLNDYLQAIGFKLK